MQRSDSRDEDFTAFVLARSARLVHIARMLCGDAALAEDLVQTALEKAYLRWDRIELGDPFGYVRQAVVNQHLRKPSLSLPPVPTAKPSVNLPPVPTTKPSLPGKPTLPPVPTTKPTWPTTKPSLPTTKPSWPATPHPTLPTGVPSSHR